MPIVIIEFTGIFQWGNTSKNMGNSQAMEMFLFAAAAAVTNEMFFFC